LALRAICSHRQSRNTMGYSNFGSCVTALPPPGRLIIEEKVTPLTPLGTLWATAHPWPALLLSGLGVFWDGCRLLLVYGRYLATAHYYYPATLPRRVSGQACTSLTRKARPAGERPKANEQIRAQGLMLCSGRNMPVNHPLVDVIQKISIY
jgi:hypothetical protein